MMLQRNRWQIVLLAGLLLAVGIPGITGTSANCYGQDTTVAAEEGSAGANSDGGHDSSKIYTSPQSILSNFFGRRRAGMLVNGLEDLVGITATGLSPLMVLSVVSPIVYFATAPEQRADLIFLYQPWFFIPIILITLLMAFKDTVLTFASYLKMPLDILGILFHFIGFLLGFRLIYHLLNIHLGEASGPLGMIIMIGIIILMFAFYTSVWVLSNVFEVLILINPFPMVDTLLRVTRVTVLLVMYVACWIHPVLGGLIALPILLVSLFTFERSLRATQLGLRLAGDVVLFRSDKIDDETSQLTAFTSIGGRLPWLTLGRLSKTEGGWVFRFRRLLIGPSKTSPLPKNSFAIAQGSLFPGLLLVTEKGNQLIARFPASYRGQEEALARQFDCEEIHDFRWSTMVQSVWNSLWRRSSKPTTETSDESTSPSEPNDVSPVEETAKEPAEKQE
ncbi:hypothetical protein GC197_00645 [bacterium]|nr:hypothetical protein [bacterium]